MDDKEILAHIDDLIKTEHGLRAKLLSAGFTDVSWIAGGVPTWDAAGLPVDIGIDSDTDLMAVSMAAVAATCVSLPLVWFPMVRSKSWMSAFSSSRKSLVISCLMNAADNGAASFAKARAAISSA